MTTFPSGSLINAPVSHVWPILADVEKWPDWADSFSSVVRLDRGALGIGSKVSIKQPKLPPGTWTITEWNPGKSFKWVSRRLAMTATADHVLENDGAKCRFSQSMCFEGLVGKLSAQLGRGLIVDYMAREADGLKRISEVSYARAAS